MALDGQNDGVAVGESKGTVALDGQDDGVTVGESKGSCRRE